MKLSKVAKYQSIDTVKTSFSDHNAIKLEKKTRKTRTQQNDNT